MHRFNNPHNFEVVHKLYYVCDDYTDKIAGTAVTKYVVYIHNWRKGLRLM